MSFLRRLFVTGLSCVLVITVPNTPARLLAQQPAPVSAERLEKARKHMEEGQSLYAQKRYLEAAQAFQLAYTAQPFAAFLFNEAVCYEKAGELDRALSTFKRYLIAEPNPPDSDNLKKRIQNLEAQIQARHTPHPIPTSPPDESKPPEAMHSLLIFESNPPGAPAQIWQKVDPTAPAFSPDGGNQGWKMVSSGPTPLVATLVPGRYHVSVERWKAYNRSDDEVDVATGRIVQYRTNLSQGEFMGFLRVTTEQVEGARIFLDDPPPHQNKPWGVTPHGELIPRGKHRIWIEAPGYEPYTEEFTIETGQQKTLQATLERVGYGYLVIDGNASAIKISIDGEQVGIYHPDDGPVKSKVSKGTHKLRAEAEGKKPYEGEVEVPAGQSREIHVVLSNRPGRGVAWGAAVFSAATLGAGIYLGLQSNSILSEMRSDRKAGHLAPDDERIWQGKIYAISANAGFTASFLLAGVAAYGFLRDPTPPSFVGVGDPYEFADAPPAAKKHLRPVSSLRLTPLLSHQERALLLQGAF
ncbi:MAG: PEGA domain-containing protein [Myxococcales bacterium]|nr:PEGA domain-containing protein [Polyangiaceae bacterium]MDW8249935.1 PEGA domain-containing protein [Myxococcales bacterium]